MGMVADHLFPGFALTALVIPRINVLATALAAFLSVPSLSAAPLLEAPATAGACKTSS